MKLVAVTACATGIAHSYMAAEALRKTAKSRGDQIKIEVQGALGIENELSPEDIESADAIILATDVSIAKMERFAKVKNKLISTGPHEVIRNPQAAFAKAEALAKTTQD
ncbi:fructose PTS transporter subunit IIB [Moorellaceae bacterium AZ2]